MAVLGYAPVVEDIEESEMGICRLYREMALGKHASSTPTLFCPCNQFNIQRPNDQTC